MRRIGIISDTHGCFDDALRRFLDPVDEIWHAGDLGSMECADAIAAFRPLVGVRGNVDGGALRAEYPEYQDFMREGQRIFLQHIVGHPDRYDLRAYALIQALHPTLVVAGHSHILRVGWDKKNGLLYINPGAAGCSGFHRVRTAVRVVADDGALRDLEVGQWPR